MREFRTSGSVGEAAGNCCLYPACRPIKLGFNRKAWFPLMLSLGGRTGALDERREER